MTAHKKQPRPLYDPSHAIPAYLLRYAATFWPSGGSFSHTPVQLLDDVKSRWEKDGMRLLEQRWTSEMIQLFFSTTPDVSPVFLAARAKGRLDHAIRRAGLRMPFSGKIGVRAVGNNVTKDVETYIENQVRNERFIDERFAHFMQKFTFVNRDVDLSQPTKTARGRYWYNLHVVLVTAERYRIVDEQRLSTICSRTPLIAAKKGHLISRLSAMPDHLHLALRGDPMQSPNDIASAYQNNLAYALGQTRIWCENFYVGTFGEYNTRAVRRGVQALSVASSERCERMKR